MGMKANQMTVAPSFFGTAGASHMLSTNIKCILTLDMFQITHSGMISSIDFFSFYF